MERKERNERANGGTAWSARQTATPSGPHHPMADCVLMRKTPPPGRRYACPSGRVLCMLTQLAFRATLPHQPLPHQSSRTVTAVRASPSQTLSRMTQWVSAQVTPRRRPGWRPIRRCSARGSGGCGVGGGWLDKSDGGFEHGCEHGCYRAFERATWCDDVLLLSSCSPVCSRFSRVGR
jgi:hypothetical protein